MIMHDIKLKNRDLKNSGMRLKITKNSFARKYIVQNIHLNMV